MNQDSKTIEDAWHIKKTVIDMETGLRGFVITGNEDFLKTYISGKEDFHRLIKQEKTLVRIEPSQIKRLEEIEKLVREWDIKAAQS